MNLDPRFPEIPDDHPSKEYEQAYRQRFYEYHRELVDSFASCVPVTGSWTPVFTFATPGNLTVAYATQLGTYTRIGTLVEADFTLVTSSFTHTTAAGAASITGLPVASVNESGQTWVGKPIWQGITFSAAGYSEVFTQLVANDTQLFISASGSGLAATNLTKFDFPTGGNVVLRGTIIYRCTR